MCEAPKFKLNPTIVEKEDPMCALSLIPPKALLIHDVRTFYHYLIQYFRKFEMNETYDALCDRDKLKPEHQYLETKGLTHISLMPKNFQIKWIRFFFESSS